MAWASSAAGAARASAAIRISRFRLQMGTLSKAVGTYGGYLCASAPVIELMRNRARTLDLFDRPAAGDRGRGHRRARSDRARAGLRGAAGAEGKSLHPRRRTCRSAKPDRARRSSARNRQRLSASQLLAEHGFLAAAIRPPTVPAGTARLRLTFTAQHPDEEIARLAGLVRDKILKHDPWPLTSSPRPAPTSARPSSPPA